MLTKAQLEKGIDEKTMGSLAGVLSPGLTRIKTTLSNTNTTLICVNQVRSNIGERLVPSEDKLNMPVIKEIL